METVSPQFRRDPHPSVLHSFSGANVPPYGLHPVHVPQSSVPVSDQLDEKKDVVYKIQIRATPIDPSFKPQGYTVTALPTLPNMDAKSTDLSGPVAIHAVPQFPQPV